MATEKFKPECPYCTIFLVVGVITFHSLTLYGNLTIGDKLYGIGGSTTGWSTVGVSVASSFEDVLNEKMNSIMSKLTSGITQIESAQSELESVMSVFGVTAMNTTNKTVTSLLQSQQSLENFESDIFAAILSALTALPNLQNLNNILEEFMDMLTPALDQIGSFIQTLSGDVMETVEEFGTTTDRVQKIFDSMTAKMMKSTGEEELAFETFNLFDVLKKGFIVEQDVTDLGNIYSISTFQGAAGQNLFQKYANKDGTILYGEQFLNFVNDPKLPDVMSVVLRSYAKMMSQVAGEVSGSKIRGDIASAVSSYFQLVTSRNLTKVGWISQALANGSLPLPFTADVLIELAESSGEHLYTMVDVGAVVVGAMTTFNVSHVMAAIDLAGNPEFFESEGYDLTEQPGIIENLTKWVAVGPALYKDLLKTMITLEVYSSENSTRAVPLLEVLEGMPATARRLTEENVRKHRQAKIQRRHEKRQALFSNDMQKDLLLHLTGGVAALDQSGGGLSSLAASVVNSGVPALPVTLKWAKWLSNNATNTAQTMQHQCYNYSKSSSSKLDAYNVQIQQIVKKITSFISLLQSKSTPAAIQSLEDTVTNFSAKALSDVMQIVEEKIIDLVNSTLSSVTGTFLELSPESLEEQLVQLEASEAHVMRRAHQLKALITKKAETRLKVVDAQKLDTKMSGVWDQVQTMLLELSTMLPTAVTVLRDARTDVTEVSATLNSLFSVLMTKGPQIFSEISSLYKMIWILYFVVLLPISLGILGYSFYASGFCGAIQSADGFEPPKTFMERCAACRRACCGCFTGCLDSTLCFWSFIIFMQVLGLILFLMSIVFTIIAGAVMFMGVGCAEIYVLGDSQVCSQTMKMIDTMLPGFSVGNVSDLNPLNEACTNHNLLMCTSLKEGLTTACMLTIIGAFLACIFTFQLIIDAATLHEKAHWVKVMQEVSKDS